MVSISFLFTLSFVENPLICSSSILTTGTSRQFVPTVRPPPRKIVTEHGRQTISLPTNQCIISAADPGEQVATAESHRRGESQRIQREEGLELGSSADQFRSLDDRQPDIRRQYSYHVSCRNHPTFCGRLEILNLLIVRQRDNRRALTATARPSGSRRGTDQLTRGPRAKLHVSRLTEIQLSDHMSVIMRRRYSISNETRLVNLLHVCRT